MSDYREAPQEPSSNQEESLRNSVPQKPSWFQRILVGGNVKFTLIRIALLVIFVFVTIKFVLIPVRCEGISMEPNFHDRSIHLVYKLAYHSALPQRGDVVSITLSGNSVLLMKRVIGLPGEKVSIRRGIVYINGEALEEPWMEGSKRSPWNRREVVLRPQEYLVIGDNRSMPMRMHTFGEVKIERILGKVIK